MSIALKHPDELQDRDILRSFDSFRAAGAQVGEFILKKSANETPFNFVQRFKGEYGAWYYSKEAEERSKARANEARNKASDHQPVVVNEERPGVVQETEASLEATVRSKVVALTEAVARAEAQYRESVRHVEVNKRKWFDAYAELRMAERFLSELEKEDGREYPPETDPPVGGDLPTEVGQRGQKRRNRVRKSVHSEGNDNRSSEADAGNTSGTGE